MSRFITKFGRRTALTAAIVLPLAACASDPPAAVDAGDYRAQLVTICAVGATERSAIAEPAETTAVAAFAREISASLSTEADSARALQAPDDLDDDHRAFVQNTADQANRWKSLASTPTDDAEAFGQLQTEILELTLGRDDLAREMELDGCISQSG